MTDRTKNIRRAAAYAFLFAVVFLAGTLLLVGHDAEELERLREENETLRTQRDEALRIVERQDSLQDRYDLLLECLPQSVAYPCNVQGCVGGLEMIEEWTLNAESK